MTKRDRALSPITKLIRKHMDTKTLSLIAISAVKEDALSHAGGVSEPALSMLKDIAAAADLHIEYSDMTQLSGCVSIVLAALAEYQCKPSQANISELLLAMNDSTWLCMNKHDGNGDYDGHKLFRGFLAYIYPYVLGEKEFPISKCPRCGKMFYKSSKNKVFCSDPCGSAVRYRRFWERKKALDATV